MEVVVTAISRWKFFLQEANPRQPRIIAASTSGVNRNAFIGFLFLNADIISYYPEIGFMCSVIDHPFLEVFGIKGFGHFILSGQLVPGKKFIIKAGLQVRSRNRGVGENDEKTVWSRLLSADNSYSSTTALLSK